jgi:uncharacterized membrane protein
MPRTWNNTTRESEAMRTISISFIALFFLVGGIAHFVWLDTFVSIMPAYLNCHKELVIISGVFELLGAGGILLPRTRRFAGVGLIALTIAVLPANINMAMHPENFPQIPVSFLYGCLPLQFLFIWLIWWAVTPISNKK